MAYKAEKISENIYFVGARDYDLRSFHGYETARGATYNAYLVIDEKITLIDTVKEKFTQEMLERIESVVSISKIDRIISNHAEFDHSGAIKAVTAKAKNAVVYATAAGVKTLTNLYGEMNYEAVKSGDSINSGKYTFTFVQTPMVHWPDNMMTFLNEEKILFSNDAFGQHLCTSHCMDTDNDPVYIAEEARKYFANIVLPYTAQAAKALVEVKKLEPRMIAPSHGTVLTRSIPDIYSLYEDIAAKKKEKLAVVCYDTMWGNTEKAAKRIGSYLEDKAYTVVYCNLNIVPASDIVSLLTRVEIFALGSPTLNNGYMPTVASLLCYIEGLKPQNLSYIAFGSFGWAGGSVPKMSAALSAMGYTKLAELAFNFNANDFAVPELSF